MVQSNFPSNLIAFQEQFGTDKACLDYVRAQRWGSATAFECPRCHHSKCWEGKTRNILYCASCEHQVSITAGTVFHNTRKSLRKWFLAMYLVTTSKQGMSAKELQRQIGLGSYQTAWAWLHKLRDCMVDPDRTPLQGEIEVDETYIGGIAEEPAKGRSTIKKTLVACAVEKAVGKNGLKTQTGRVRLAVIQNATQKSLEAFMNGKLEPETTIHTDGWRGYDAIERSGYQHIRTVADSSEAHLFLPRVHRVFSLLKRWLLGTHQGAVSRKHLQAYLEEYTFRFNRRKAHNLVHSFQRLAEGAIRNQCRPYWQIVGRLNGGLSMRQNLNLQGILECKQGDLSH